MLGLGFGGFLDGIVAHQILGWHHMLSSWYPPDNPADLHLNMVGDGLFHLLCLIFVLVGVVLLNRGTRLPWPVLWGGAFMGWGIFNLVEGTIDHLILGVHHVRPGGHQLTYDLGFLALGAVLIVIGLLMTRRYAKGHSLVDRP
ncbi:hypothetical protein H074_33269 [Amycolatopsis decaplanina DSM 44594]|uniref:DUF2243 domain-containing protein n=2 Tax=Amycolatopsis decaplanina TaxID=208441 RepID=M2YVU7_9PSEU|nr:hypothetical protein H074_33269 [Amycolatopsis decaplanina DSM 44594]